MALLIKNETYFRMEQMLCLSDAFTVRFNRVAIFVMTVSYILRAVFQIRYGGRI